MPTHEDSLFYGTALFIEEVLKMDKESSTACGKARQGLPESIQSNKMFGALNALWLFP